jgi:methylthioribose-1-phosphate isomerase
MKKLISSAFKFDGKQLLILDQQKLPKVSEWIPCTTVDELVTLIQRLAIRGAPLIGISAAVLLGHLAEQGTTREELLKAATTLRAARPTAVNLMHCIDRMVEVIKKDPFNPEAVVTQAEAIFDEDVALCQAIAEQGASIINQNEQILTHCNTGGLATAGVGTALGVIFQAHDDGKNIHVYVDETRPLLQGARLTAWELHQKNIPYTLLSDNMAAALMQQGKITKILVGADRIAANGDFANKIGTYSIAVLAHYHHIPFYVVAPQTTVDLHCSNGDCIEIEQRKSEEVTGFSGSTGTVSWAPEGANVYNPAFDVTPAKLITGWILDSGVYTDFSQYVLSKGEHHV